MKVKSRTSPRLRSKRNGQSGVDAGEVAIASILMVAMAALASDITLLIFANSLNDSACRDAARAAGQNSTSAAALVAAKAQLIMHATDGNFISQPTLTSTQAPDFVYNDYTGNPPANTSPYVTVTTGVNVKLPFLLDLFGANFYGGSNHTVLFTRRYTFPIVKEKFYG
jgi:hypothetical protein